MKNAPKRTKKFQPEKWARVDLTRFQFVEVRSQINEVIHELVFGVAHIEQGDSFDAQECLKTAKDVITDIEKYIQRKTKCGRALPPFASSRPSRGE